MKQPKTYIRIGQSITNDARINQPGVDHHHAELQYTQGVWLLTDLGTAGGTYVNDWPIVKKVVVDQDVLRFGDVRITMPDLFHLAEEVIALPNEQSTPSTPTIGQPMMRADAAELLSISESDSVDTMLMYFRKKRAYIHNELKTAATPGQITHLQQALQALEQAKETMLAGYPLSTENLPSPTPVVSRLSGSQPYQLTPERPKPIAAAPIVWYARPSLLWSSVALLLLVSLWMTYERYRNHLLTPAQFRKYTFLTANFEPRSIKVKNSWSQPLTVEAITILTYGPQKSDDSKRNDTVWAWKPLIYQPLSPGWTLQPGAPAADLPLLGNLKEWDRKAVFVNLLVRDVNQEQYQFPKSLAPGSPDVNERGEIILNLKEN